MPAEGGFLHSVWERPRLGAWQWAAEKLVDSGLRLIHAVHPKLSRLGVIERLAEMFPTRLASVVVEILTIKNPVLFKALLGIEDPAGDPPSGAPPAGASMEEPGK